MTFGNRFSHSIVAKSFDLDVTMNTNNLAVIEDGDPLVPVVLSPTVAKMPSDRVDAPNMIPIPRAARREKNRRT
jgi:hypothetical protein